MNETTVPGFARVNGKDTNTQSDRHTHEHTRNCAAKMNNGARAAVPREASDVWRDETCLLKSVKLVQLFA